MKVLVLNGPNLNLLGTREPDVYGSTTLAELEEKLMTWGANLGMEVVAMQSNAESELVDAIQATDADAIVINPAALTHTSRSIGDAIASRDIPAVEVHISNIRQREPWRAESLVAPACDMTIYGRGVTGYRDALRHIRNRAAHPAHRVTYGPHADNIGDLRGEGDRLWVLVHGGFWRGEWERDTMESLAVDIAGRGHVSWNLEYRRLGNGGGWPGSYHDVKTALDFIPQLGLAIERITVIGHSAGAHIGTWSAARARTTIDQILNLAPVTDLQELAGSDRIGSTEARILIEAGAPSQVTPAGIPATIVHGSDDDLVPVEMSRMYADSAETDLVVTDNGHFDLLDPSAEYWAGLID